MKKKIISLCLVIALVATAIAGATLAYFTDYTDEAVNTFTVGNVNIELDEKDTDDSTPNEERDTANTYEDIYPSPTVEKDPMVTVKGGSESSYVRMFVTANVEKLEAAFPEFMDGDIFDLENLVVDENGKCTWDKDIWACVGVVDNGDGTATYEFRYHTTTTESDDDVALEPLFTHVTIPGFATNDDLKALVDENGEFEIKIIAEAIQAADFDDADDAWGNFVREATKQ